MKRKQVEELVGWYGAAAIILAYYLVSFGHISATGFLYHIMNATGAIGIVIISIRKNAWQPATLNLIWATIAVIVILRKLLG